MALIIAQSFMELLTNHALKPDFLPLKFFTSKSLLHGLASKFAPSPAAVKAHFILGSNKNQLDTWFSIFFLARAHFVCHCIEMLLICILKVSGYGAGKYRTPPYGATKIRYVTQVPYIVFVKRTKECLIFLDREKILVLFSMDP
jgi:hypothetical protein